MHTDKLTAYAKRLWLVDPDLFAPYVTRTLAYSSCYTREQLNAQKAELETRAADAFGALAIQSRGIDLPDERMDTPKAIRAVKGKVGVIPVHGPVDQHWSSELAKSGGTSLDFVSLALDIGLANPGIGAIVLHMDCPGGTSHGVEELGAKISKARAEKPIYAMIDSMACSAGYWIASACSMVICTPGGDAGSIGVYRLHLDESKALEDAGVKPTFVFAGRHKVEFAPTSPLSEDARARMQQRVDETYSKFIGAVASYRGTSLEDVRKNYGEGRVLSASESKAAGLVDRIMSYQDFLAKLTGSDGAVKIPTQPQSMMDAGADKEKMRLRVARERAQTKSGKS